MYPKYQICYGHISFIFQFTEVPYGPLRRYITPDIDDILDVQHLADTFVVNSLSDVAPLKEAAKSYSIKVTHIIQCNFSDTIIDVGKKVPGYEEIPPPLVNVFLEYGNKYIVRDCHQILLLTLTKFSDIIFLGDNIYQDLFYLLIAHLPTCSVLF